MAKFRKSRQTFSKPFACGLFLGAAIQNKIFLHGKGLFPPNSLPVKACALRMPFTDLILSPEKKVSHSAHAFTGKGLIQK